MNISNVTTAVVCHSIMKSSLNLAKRKPHYNCSEVGEENNTSESLCKFCNEPMEKMYIGHYCHICGRIFNENEI